jgi:hypothetical protein
MCMLCARIDINQNSLNLKLKTRSEQLLGCLLLHTAFPDRALKLLNAMAGFLGLAVGENQGSLTEGEGSVQFGSLHKLI